jgi:phytol kinase
VTPPVPILTSPAAGLAIVLGLMLALMLGVRLYQVVAKPHPEIARKLFHVGGGFIAMSLPWLFDRWWPVVAMGAVSTSAFVLLRGVTALRASVGQVLGSVERRSAGEFYYLLAVVVLFGLSGRAPVLFAVPVLILAVADASAALVGVRYGQVHFRTVEGGRKSAEGSLAFLVAAFLCVHLPLLLWTTTGRAESLLIAANVALMAMMAEAIAWRGIDNFIIPFFAYVLLRTYLPMSTRELGLQTAVLTGLFVFVYAWRGYTNMAANARLGGVLFGYVVWLLAGWLWLLPPILLFSLYRVITKKVDRDASRHIDFPVLGPILLPPLLWVVLESHRHDALFFAGFNAVIASQLALIGLVRHKHANPGASWTAAVAVNVGKGLLMLVPPAALGVVVGRGDAHHLLEAAATVVVATFVFGRLQPALEAYPLDAARWIRQGLCVLGASFLCFGVPLLRVLQAIGSRP